MNRISLVKVFRKKIVPSNYEDFSPTDTLLAFLLFAVITLILLVGTFLQRDYLSVSSLTKFQLKLYNSGVYSVIFMAMLLMLRLRKQGLKTVGLQKKGLTSSLMAGSLLIAYFVVRYISQFGFKVDLLLYLVYYIVVIGFVEEVVFRGFLWGRLYKAFGFGASTIITGLLFSLAHFPIEHVVNHKNLWDLLAGNVNISLMGGVFIHFVLSYVYSRSNNIVLPAIVHGFMDILSVLN